MKLFNFFKKNKDEFNDDEWLNKANELLIDLSHPKYLDEDKKVMEIRGAKGLRYAEPDKENTIPHYLVIRESIRRWKKGFSNKSNNYLKLAVRSYERLQDRIVDDKLNITGSYASRYSTGKKGVRHLEGELNKEGFKYVPYFRVFVPHEEFDLLNRIGKLKGEWNNTTRLDGIKKGDVESHRKEVFDNGFADSLLKKYNLPIAYKNKLTLKFFGKKKK